MCVSNILLFFLVCVSIIEQTWDHTQRKVVRYDHSIADKIEPKGGHGTKVAGAAVGKAKGHEDDEANGIAEDAKLHIFDIQEGTGKFIMQLYFTFEDELSKLILCVIHSSRRFI